MPLTNHALWAFSRYNYEIRSRLPRRLGTCLNRTYPRIFQAQRGAEIMGMCNHQTARYLYYHQDNDFVLIPYSTYQEQTPLNS